MNTYIGIDLGTSVIKAVVMRDDGKIIASSSKQSPLITPKPDQAEQSPITWWDLTVAVLKELSSKTSLKSAKGIGLSGQMHGLVMYDKSLKPVGNAIVWLDKRSKDEVKEIEQKIGKKTSYETTGNPLFTGLLLPSLLWVRKHDSSTYHKIHMVSSPKDYICYKLTGILRTEPTDALATGAYDYKKGAWAKNIIEKLNLNHALFPKIEPTHTPYGATTKSVSEHTGLPIGIPVFGGSDQSMAALGMGLTEEGNASIAISTGGQFLVVGKKGLIDEKQRLHTLNHAIDTVGLYMAATLTAGISLQWLKDKATDQSNKTFDKFLQGTEEIKAGSEGLFFLPFLAGERTPFFNSEMKGAFIGLSLIHTRLHLTKAVMEGVSYSIKTCLEVFKNVGLPIKQIILSGGGTKHNLWGQTISDVLNMPLETVSVTEHSPFGAAILAKFAPENFKGLSSFHKKIVTKGVIYTPKKEDIIKYASFFEQYKKHANYLNCLKNDN